MTSQQLDVAREAYGDAFVAYVLNADPAELDRMTPTQPQAAALVVLWQFAQMVLSANEGLQRALLRTNILRPLPDLPALGLTARMRLQCGGSVPSIESSDAAEAALLTLVRDAYGALLFPSSEDASSRYGGMRFGGSVFGHQAHRDLVLAIVEDPDLRRLFPGSPDAATVRSASTTETAGIQSQLMWLSGRGGTFQLEMVPEHLIAYAFNLVVLHGEPSLERAFTHAREGLAVARALARGDAVNLPLIVGLSNVDLADDYIEIAVPSAKLTRPGDRALEWLGRTGISGRPIKAVLIASAPQQLLHVEQWGIGEELSLGEGSVWERFLPRQRVAYQATERRVNLFRLALLLSSDDSTPIATAPEITTSLSPLEFGGGGALGSWSPVMPYAAVTLTQEVSGRATAWWKRVLAEHPPSLDIAMRRLISATATRLDPMDGFIDAVMAWENLFGDVQDTALKVCGSLARLLEPDDAVKRDRLYRQLKKLYSVRSRLVHGASEPDIETAYRHREEAVRVALAAVRKAYELPGLLKLKKSVDRYEMVLLGLSRTGATATPGGG